MKKTVNISNIADYKDDCGFWVRSKTVTKEGQHYTATTRAGVLWGNVSKRCLENGSNKRDHPTYKDCKNCFLDFQEFAGWCQLQKGYMEKEENGKYWSLDKDIIESNNKAYSPDTCVFVPHTINVLFSKLTALNPELPIGVHFDNRTGLYRASCNNGQGKGVKLGRFTNIMAAHRAWQLAKIKVVSEILNEFEERLADSVVSTINELIVRLSNDYENQIESRF